MTVQQIKYVGIKIVLTPAQDCVVLMLFAQFQAMFQVVIVSMVTRVLLHAGLVIVKRHAN